MKSLRRNNFIFSGLKNSSILAFGNIVSEFITFVTFIFIARYFVPEQYGIYTTVLTYVAVFEIFTLKGLNKTILRSASKQPNELEKLLQEGSKFRLLFIIGAIVVCNFCLLFFRYNSVTKLLILIFSINLYFNELTRFYLNAYYVINKVNMIAKQTIYNRVLFALLAWLIIFLNLKINYLVYATTTVNIFFFIYSIIKLKQENIDVSPFQTPKYFKAYIKSGMTFSLFEAVTMLSTRFDIFLISLLGDSKEVGIYGVSYRIAQQILMLRNVNQDSFYPMIVQRLQKGLIDIKKILSLSIALFLIVIIPTIVFSFYSRDLIAMLFGSSYEEAGPILTYLLIFVAFAWGTLPFTLIAQSSYNETVLLKVRFLMAVANVILDVIFYNIYGLIGIAYVSAIVWAVGSLLICYFTYRKIYLN